MPPLVRGHSGTTTRIWEIERRKGAWDRSVVPIVPMVAGFTGPVAIAIPMLFVSALIEAYVWPDLIRAASPLFG